ncbi:hypothetical protein [Streptomyces sp. NBC_00057]|uniref:hypothetical protein n=1 Tax=Streptomyces sp. NBC_00057 TaxID=2975634 RepID=UPI00324CF3F8
MKMARVVAADLRCTEPRAIRKEAGCPAQAFGEIRVLYRVDEHRADVNLALTSTKVERLFGAGRVHTDLLTGGERPVLPYHPTLLPICDEEVRRRRWSGDIPELSELILHNSPIHRWERPV